MKKGRIKLQKHELYYTVRSDILGLEETNANRGGNAMGNEKIKPKLNGTAETMLQCFYTRAMHSRNPKNKFHDAKAEELNIACSVLDPSWAAQVKVRGMMLFIIEGLTMYMTAADVKTMLGIIRDNFDNAYVCMETLCPFFVKKEGIEKSIKATGASFL